MKMRLYNTVLFLLFVFCSSAYSQSGVGVSPPRIEFEGGASTTYTQEIAIDNPSEQTALDVTVTINDVLFQPDGESIFLDPGSHPNSLTPWIAVSSLEFTLEPGGTQTVTYTLQIPEGTRDGSYWGILFFESEAAGTPDSPPGGISIRSRVRVGHVMYAHVGEVELAGEIQGIRLIAETEPEIRVMFNNTGNGVIRTQGKLEVRTEVGELVQDIPVEGAVSFPGYSSEIITNLEEPLDSGNYIVLAVLDYGAATVVSGEGQIQVP